MGNTFSPHLAFQRTYQSDGTFNNVNGRGGDGNNSHPGIPTIHLGPLSNQPRADGGERGIPNNNLFGGIHSDISSFFPFPFGLNHHTPASHSSPTIKFHVNLDKDSVHLVRSDEDHNQYQLQFKYDASVPCNIRVYYIATMVIDENLKSVIQARSELSPLFCDKGFGQVYLQSLQSFDISLLKEVPSPPIPNQFPIVISLQTIPGEDNTTETQYTFATLLHCADDSYAIKVVQQKIQYHEKMYSLHDIYGLDHTGERESEGSRECIVCLSEPRDTTVLPCRHLCLCSGCADMMRMQTNKCPICRSPVRSLLRIVLAKDIPSTTSNQDSQDSGDDDHEDQLLNRRQRDREMSPTKEEVLSVL